MVWDRYPVSGEDEVLAAAYARAKALGQGDEPALRRLLHAGFSWTSYTGELFDREAYLEANIRSRNQWHGQRLEDPHVVVVGDAAVLRCTVTDDVDTGAGRQPYRMFMTQTWVRIGGAWVCLLAMPAPAFKRTRSAEHRKCQ